jgi:hypothetical protein
MSLAEHHAPSRAKRPGDGAGLDWPGVQTFERLQRSPRAALRLPGGGRMVVHVDRVRAKPAISPSLSMNIGLTAIGLGLWGALFPHHVKKTLGVAAPAGAVQAVFGLRELATGFTLAGDPTKAGMLWARVAGDAFDIAALRALDNPRNRKRVAARAALGFVLAVTALDLVAAVRMTGVRRNGH